MRNQILVSGVNEAKTFSEWSPHDVGRDLEAYALVYLTAGSGYFRDQNYQHHLSSEVTAGTVMVLFPGLRHRYGRRLQDALWSERYLVFNGPLFTELEKSALLDRQQVVLQTANDAAFRASFAALVADHQSGEFYHDQYSGIARVHALIAEVYRLHQQHAQGRSQQQKQWREEACALLLHEQNIEKNMQSPPHRWV